MRLAVTSRRTGTSCSRFRGTIPIDGTGRSSRLAPPFPVPGWVMYDGRLLDDRVVEIRRIEFVTPTAAW
jgi:hypothetical protein